MTTSDSTFERWRDRVRAEIGVEDAEEALRTTLTEGISVAPLYTESNSSMSGGPRPRISDGSGSRSEPTLCTLADDPDIDELNSSIRRAFRGGSKGLWLCMDRASRLGTDPCCSSSGPDIGVEGTTAYCVSDLGRVLRDIPLNDTTFFLDAGANALPNSALLLAYLDEAGIDPATLRLGLGWDPLGALARDGSVPRPMLALNEEAATLVRWSSECLSEAWPLTVSSLPYHDGGADAVDELAAAIATGIYDLHTLSSFGIEPLDAAPGLLFRIGIGTDVFLEIAKLRALRILWDGVLVRFGSQPDGGVPVSVHAVTSRRTVSRAAPWVNLLRQTTEVFGAVVGGADLVTPRSVPAGADVSDILSERLARNSLLTLTLEGHLGDVCDPGAGSYYIEALTQELARRAWERVREIERSGGMLNALESGEIQQRIRATAEERTRSLRDGERHLLGVTRFVPEGTAPADRTGPPTDVVRCARGRLDCTRETRVCDPAPEPLSVDCQRARNALDRLVRCAGCGGTIGEMSEALAPNGFGPSVEAIPVRRESEPFEISVPSMEDPPGQEATS